MIISCTADKKYTRLLKIFLKSLQANSPDYDVHVRLVNGDPDEISDIHERLVIQADNVDYSTVRKNLARNDTLLYGSLFDNNQQQWAGATSRSNQTSGGFKGPRWAVSDLQCYCSNIRFRNIYNLLQAEHSSVLYMDVDAIVRRDLYDLQDIIDQHDITIRTNLYTSTTLPTDLPDGIEWHCGIIGVRNNPTSKKFIKQVMEQTEQNMFYWDSDQDEFNNVYKDMERDVVIGNLPEEFKDQGPGADFDNKTQFDEQSYIWSGAGTVKADNAAYIKEMKLYE